MNWRHQQKMTEDADDQNFLAEEQEQNVQEGGDDEIDPLDAFMDDLKETQKQENTQNRQQKRQEKGDCAYSEDESSSPVQFSGDSEGEMAAESDKEGEVIESEQEDRPQKRQSEPKKQVDILKPVDFSLLDLKDFEKNFYEEHEDITNLNDQEVKSLMKEMQMKVSGSNLPRPVVSFGHLPLNDNLKQLMVRRQYEKPTPIQAIALPAVMLGRDVVGIAKTGSGKTLAYVLPMIVHVSNQELAQKKEGPVAIVLAPTRELCQQIYLEAKKFGKHYGIRVCSLLGGENKHEQWRNLKAGVDVLIASPGRLIEMLKKKATNLQRITYLVLDEADKMLSLGFQQQIRSIIGQTRQDRQTLLFTATMDSSMRFLVGDIITSPVRIKIGQEGAANQDVKQEVIIVKDPKQKYNWLALHIKECLTMGKVLLFANFIQSCEDLGQYLAQNLDIDCLILHGDKTQYERTQIMNKFKQEAKVLVATDIAARGIDVKNIKTVINFECPKQIQAYIHRIGRTGRAGETGVAYTFLHRHDTKLAIELLKTFEHSGYPVSEELENLACSDDKFKRKRLSAKMGVSFAKGKDATKYLGQIIKKQRTGFSRAGLGMDEGNRGERGGGGKGQHILKGEKDLANKSISQLSAMIREKRQAEDSREEKFGHFVKSEADLRDGLKEAQVTFLKKKPDEV